jgi:hypothetical protein
MTESGCNRAQDGSGNPTEGQLFRSQLGADWALLSPNITDHSIINEAPSSTYYITIENPSVLDKQANPGFYPADSAWPFA